MEGTLNPIQHADSQQFLKHFNLINNVEVNVVFFWLEDCLILIMSPLILKWRKTTNASE